jgi:hypothetical protein
MHLMLQIILVALTFATTGAASLKVTCVSASICIVFVLASVVIDWRTFGCVAWERTFIERHAPLRRKCLQPFLFLLFYIVPAVLVLTAAFTHLPPAHDAEHFTPLDSVVFSLAIIAFTAVVCHMAQKTVLWYFRPQSDAHQLVDSNTLIHEAIETINTQLAVVVDRLERTEARLGTLEHNSSSK